MSDSLQPHAPSAVDNQAGERASSSNDELPPVEPPSAGFIVQLFVVPLLIVVAIIGVIALFGKISESDQDWRQLVKELDSANEHRRWRAAQGLAFLLRADQDRPPAEQQLTRNPQVARALVELFRRQLARKSTSEDDLKQQSFIARSLQWLDVPDLVLPALQEAIGSAQDREIRKDAFSSLAVIAGRTAERAAAQRRGGVGSNAPAASRSTLAEVPGLLDDVLEASGDPDPLMRQLAAFTLGMLPADASRQRLEVLLNDADAATRINAAVGLSRQESTAGFPVFRQVLADAGRERSGRAERSARSSPAEQRQKQNEAVMELHTVANTLKAVGRLSQSWSDSQRSELAGLIEPVADGHAEPRIRTDARQALLTLGEMH